MFGDIIEATEDFDIKYCFGTGGYGSVYITQLTSSKVIALKKLHHWENEEPASTRSFQNEVDILYPKYDIETLLSFMDFVCIKDACFWFMNTWRGEACSVFCTMIMKPLSWIGLRG